MDHTADAKKILSSKGAKLSAHEIHLRRTANKGYVARHMMRDKDGNPPMDGQAPEQEYHANNLAELQAHLGQHFGPPEEGDADQDDQQSGV